MRKPNKKTTTTKREIQPLSPKELAKVGGGYFELHGSCANEVLLNAWWDAGAAQ